MYQDHSDLYTNELHRALITISKGEKKSTIVAYNDSLWHNALQKKKEKEKEKSLD